MTTLIDRLRKRAEEDLACAANNDAVADALKPQMDLFNRRGGHNTYAVRMFLDHHNGATRDRQYAADLLQAIKLLETTP
ncbi:hypothetical protein C3Y94_025955 [Rhizobium ruizarguesonis]|uniref:hypothetical protein n=1 Tax=Rhizobium ruizarguesonis TaxID=2081791 RepID=UPI00163AE2E9|nr:hypothetical protein [Rhizobium ruizarguesonis]MBC2806599.1 hypothetical protein [Rhizobium ruizarguesonis]